MKNHIDCIAVTSKSFSKNELLRKELLAHYSNIKFNDQGLKLEGQLLIDFIKDCNKVIVGLEKFDANNLQYLPKLEVISRFGVGLNGIDLNALCDYNIRLSCVPGVNRLAVAELTLSFMLMLIRNSFYPSFQLKQGQWNKTAGQQLTGKTIGIVGVNHIGKEVVRLLQPFQCRILTYDIIDLSDYCKNCAIEQVNFDTLIQQSDIISLHVPATPKTFHMINEAVINKMKKSAFLINTARGEIIDQNALKKALQNNIITGAALDVYQEEPIEDKELLSLSNLICTPHIAGNTQESELLMGRAAILGLESATLPFMV